MPDIKRLNYFNQQFLIEADFEDEQKYHLDMRRRHNRLLHTPGIGIEGSQVGLQVLKADAKKVRVTPGTALDVRGQEMILLEDFVIDLTASPSTSAPNATVFITITYSEKEADPQPPASATPIGNTRVTEKPTISATTAIPPVDGSVIQLAKITLNGDGNIPGNADAPLDGGVRTVAGAKLADNSVSIDKLKKTLSVLSGTDTITLAPSATAPIQAFSSRLNTASNTASSAFLLVYAFSPTPGAKFSWTQEYSTSTTAPNTIDQTVIFKNLLGTAAIVVKYKIYVVLEN